jgi:hypothetical protein
MDCNSILNTSDFDFETLWQKNLEKWNDLNSASSSEQIENQDKKSTKDENLDISFNLDNEWPQLVKQWNELNSTPSAELIEIQKTILMINNSAKTILLDSSLLKDTKTPNSPKEAPKWHRQYHQTHRPSKKKDKRTLLPKKPGANNMKKSPIPQSFIISNEFTPEEDEKLINCSNKYKDGNGRILWKKISIEAFNKSKDPFQLQERFLNLQKKVK